MQQTISISLSHQELTDLIQTAVTTAVNSRLQPAEQENLMTVEEASQYLKCSQVFLWKKRKEGKIIAVNAGKKVLYPKSSLDAYLQLKQVKKSIAA